MNFNKMTIKEGKVFKLNWHTQNFGLSHAKNTRKLYLPHWAKPKFEGNFEDCLLFIKSNGAEYTEI